jgi:poly-D-alanine transfer protein DltD
MANLVERVTTLLKTEMAIRWQNGGKGKYPYDTVTPQSKRKKPHALDTAFKYNVTYMISPEMNYFEIGNPRAEAITPHYHILEDSKIIRMPKRSTEKSRGSQGSQKQRSKRDYSVLSYAQGTTTVVQEYRQQIKRNYFGIGTKVTQPREYEKRKKVSNINKRYYRNNKYFMYIETLLEDVVVFVANSINGTVKRETDSVIPVGENRTDLGRAR